MNKSKLNLMGHETYTTRFHGPWKWHESKTWPDLNLMGDESMYSFMAMKSQKYEPSEI